MTDIYIKPGSVISAYLDPKEYETNFKLNPLTNFKKGCKDWNLIRILNEDYFIIDKPPGIPSVSPKDAATSSFCPFWLRKYLPRSLGSGKILITSRLDAGTHGLLVIGRNKKFVTQYNKLIQSGKVIKKYTAVVTGWNPKIHKTGLWEHYFHERLELVSNRITIGETSYSTVPETCDHLIMKSTREITEKNNIPVKLIVESAKIASKDSLALRPFDQDWVEKIIKEAELRNEPLYELKINLITGKTHQIRSQLECEGVRIVGDWLYGSDLVPMKDTFALCCSQLSWSKDGIDIDVHL